MDWLCLMFSEHFNTINPGKSLKNAEGCRWTLFILAEWTCEADFYKGFQVVSLLFYSVLLASSSSSSSTASSCWTSGPDSSHTGRGGAVSGHLWEVRLWKRPCSSSADPSSRLMIPCKSWGVDLLVWDMSDRCCSRTNFVGLFSCWFRLTVGWLPNSLNGTYPWNSVHAHSQLFACCCSVFEMYYFVFTLVFRRKYWSTHHSLHFANRGMNVCKCCMKPLVIHWV